MARENRPKPPPLDDAQPTPPSDDDLAAQGKAALAELESKHAEAGSAKSPNAASALETQSDGELAARAAGGPPPVPKMPVLGKVRASIRDTKDGFIARPDPACPIGEDVPVVRFNWCGLVGGRRVDVASGTPVECLPDTLVERIGRTPNAIIAPRGPKPPPNPHAP